MAAGAGGIGADQLAPRQKDAAKAHEHLDVAKMFMFGVGGAALIAITAGAAAPFVGAAVDATAGLSGAAALLHGLAMIGGGSLAAGGWRMAGGFWILTGTGALVGAAGGSTTAALVSLGAEGARAELMKLQVTFKQSSSRVQNGRPPMQSPPCCSSETMFENRSRRPRSAMRTTREP